MQGRGPFDSFVFRRASCVLTMWPPCFVTDYNYKRGLRTKADSTPSPSLYSVRGTNDGNKRQIPPLAARPPPACENATLLDYHLVGGRIEL